MKDGRTWAEIDLDVIAANYRYIKTGTDAKVCCVIKADAYSHGDVYLARKYQQLGAEYFAVSNIEEALRLRAAGISTPVLILGYTPAENAQILAENEITQCVYSTEYAEKLSEKAVAFNCSVRIHIKVDTGMSRLGFCYQNTEADASAIDEIAAVCALPGLKHEGIFTHFAVADDGERGECFTRNQMNCFTHLVEELKEKGLEFKLKHCANSAGTLDFTDSHFDMVRAGIILYGLTPSGAMRNKGDFKPALSLKSVVSNVKTIRKGATVSYGRTFTAEKDMYIATVPIGYADGYSRHLSEAGACLLLRGRRCPIVGRVCMDQLMIDLGDMDDVKIGEVVTVIGTDGNESVTADELAALDGTINYEVLCSIGTRVPRIYLEGGKEVARHNYIYSE